MPITLTCPGCRWLLQIPKTAKGKKVRCPQCALIFPSGNEAEESPTHVSADPDKPPKPDVPMLDVLPAEESPVVLEEASPEEWRPARRSPANPPAKSRSWLGWAIGGTAAAVVVLVLACGGAGYLLYRTMSSPSIPDRDWSLFSIPGTSASVRMPGSPARQADGSPNPVVTTEKWTLRRPKENYEFVVFTMKVTNGKQYDAVEFRRIVDTERDSMKNTVFGVVDKQTETTLDGRLVNQFEISGINKQRLIVRYYLDREPGGSRLYGLYVTGPGIKADAGVPATFFQSFQLGPTSPQPVTPPIDPIKPAEPVKPLVDVVRPLDDPWTLPAGGNLLANVRAGDQAGQRLGLDLVGSTISGIALSPDEKTLAVSVNLGPVQMFDATTGALKASYDGHHAPVVGMAFSPDGAWFATACNQTRKIRIHDTAKNKAVADLLQVEGRPVTIESLAFSPDSQTLAAVMDGQPRLWQAPTWAPKNAPNVPGGKVRNFVFGPDNNTAAVVTSANGVYVWDLGANKQKYFFATNSRVQSVPAFSPDGMLLAANADSMEFIVWDLKQGKEYMSMRDKLKVPDRFLFGAFAPDGKIFAAGQNNSVVRLWNVPAGTARADLDLRRSGIPIPSGVYYTKDGKTLITAGGAKVVFWDVAKAEEANQPDLVLTEQVDSFQTAAIDPDGKAVLLLREDKMKVYSYLDFKLRGEYLLPAVGYRAALDRKQGLLYLAMSEKTALEPATGLPAADVLLGKGDLHVYDVKGAIAGTTPVNTKLEPKSVIATNAVVVRMKLSPDARWLYYLYWHAAGDVRLARIDTQTLKSSDDIKVGGSAQALALTADGKSLFVAGEVKTLPGGATPQTVYQVDTMEWKVVKTMETTVKPFDLAVTKSGFLFVAGGETAGNKMRELVILDVDKGTQVRSWAAYQSNSFIQLSPDEKRLYKTGTGGVFADLFSWAMPPKLPAPPPPIHPVAVPLRGGEVTISPDGRFLLDRSGKVFGLAN
jgi:LSD1 subclass zinc finger protein